MPWTLTSLAIIAPISLHVCCSSQQIWSSTIHFSFFTTQPAYNPTSLQSNQPYCRGKILIIMSLFLLPRHQLCYQRSCAASCWLEVLAHWYNGHWSVRLPGFLPKTPNPHFTPSPLLKHFIDLFNYLNNQISATLLYWPSYSEASVTRRSRSHCSRDISFILCLSVSINEYWPCNGSERAEVHSFR